MEFGCTEWSGLTFFLFWAAGLAAVVLYAIGATILAVAEARRGSAVTPLPRSDQSDEARHID